MYFLAQVLIRLRKLRIIKDGDKDKEIEIEENSENN